MKKPLTALAITVAILVGALLAQALAPAAVAAPPAMKVVAECSDYCHPEMTTCPPMVCPSGWALDSACKQAACAAYNASVAQCNLTACTACEAALEAYDAKVDALESDLDAAIAECAGKYRNPSPEYDACCESARSTYYDGVLAAGAVFFDAEDGITSDWLSCTGLALNAYNGTQCCIEQH